LQLAVVLNVAGGTLKKIERDEAKRLIERGLADGGHDASVEMVEPNGVEIAIRRALDRGVDGVVAGGGDGTISHATNLLADTGKAMGVLPLGTLNLFARDLDMPLQLSDAVHALATADRMEIDVAEVNGRVFAIHASLGVYPWVLRRRDEQQSRFGWTKWPAFGRAALKALSNHPVLKAQLDIDGEQRDVETPLLMVACNPVADHAGPLLRRDALASGKLVLYIGRNNGTKGLLKIGVDALRGTWNQSNALDNVECERLTVHSRRRRLVVALDGEVDALETPLRFHVRPRALTVLKPKAAA